MTALRGPVIALALALIPLGACGETQRPSRNSDDDDHHDTSAATATVGVGTGGSSPRAPNGPNDELAVENIATIFETNNRSMQRVFAETAVYCMGN